ncbi:hypothetical protein G7054_g907 [Neopestalotiopsis clavispora]|nr:hypothetical protein G7054_g907 [Neopestalotiopsis clavispora]
MFPPGLPANKAHHTGFEDMVVKLDGMLQNLTTPQNTAPSPNGVYSKIPNHRAKITSKPIEGITRIYHICACCHQTHADVTDVLPD